MRVLVGCEFSGIVRDAFAARGHDAWSCDLLETEVPGNHIQGDVLDVLGDGWDLAIFHPPCTYLASSGALYWAKRQSEQAAAIAFFRSLYGCGIPQIAVENPIGIMSTVLRKPDQIIQPWRFGHGETKATCLWLKGLPKLEATDVVEGRENNIMKLGPSADRWKIRSRTYKGIAAAMADQWG